MSTPQRLFSIVGQNQRSGFDQGRNLTQLLEVYYEGPNGISGSVSVPLATANAEVVDRAIRTQLGRQLEIAQLGQ